MARMARKCTWIEQEMVISKRRGNAGGIAAPNFANPRPFLQNFLAHNHYYLEIHSILKTSGTMIDVMQLRTLATRRP